MAYYRQSKRRMAEFLVALLGQPCSAALTVIETCRQQCRNVFAFVTAAVEARLARQPAPSLLSTM